jgi:hypothetical protein
MRKAATISLVRISNLLFAIPQKEGSEIARGTHFEPVPLPKASATFSAIASPAAIFPRASSPKENARIGWRPGRSR